jgi:metal-responsive CopG/Arc/MetJ family transcriptional regulator
MKTAISLPDQLFEHADSLATKLKISRSQFYATALEKYISELEKSTITQKMNEFIDKYGQDSDPAMDAFVISEMRKVEWK